MFHEYLCVLVTQSCPTLCDPMDCSPPGFSVHGILQAWILEWIVIPFSRGTSQPRDQTLVSCVAGRFFTIWATEKSLNWARPMKVAQSCLTLCDPMDYTVHGILQARILEWGAFPFSRGSSQARDQTQVSRIAGGFFTSWVTREAAPHIFGISGLNICNREFFYKWSVFRCLFDHTISKNRKEFLPLLSDKNEGNWDYHTWRDQHN